MTNRLENEKSPYLLQHAHNPVDWYPWSDEAFSDAAKNDKPIFLSIGYSTCHWCHVMERESFEDEEVAKMLNETFVCIKVDREERPDIDTIYMTVCTMMTGSGGWPLTIVMTPDKKPFFAGTYFGKHTQYGRIGMLELIPRIQDIWQNRREEVIQSATKIFTILMEQNESTPGSDPDIEILHRAFNELSGRYDTSHGGFGNAPKFPTPHTLTFLLRYWDITGNEQARTMVEHTLSAMRQGGIFDHVGFGFHRYSTDEKWLLPHFEKMLYDQALMAVAYLETYQVTGNFFYKQVAEEIFTYVMRDMTSPAGGFYSAEDADSEGVEGKYYVWTHAELQASLSPDELNFISDLYNIKPEGNFHDEATHRKTGANIFHLTATNLSDSSSMSRLGIDSADHEKMRRKLYGQREQRVHPHKDDKILTDWNGLMLGALAMGARILDAASYLDAATKSANFFLSCMRKADGRLLHRYREGESAIDGMLNDYAYLVWGLLELYAAGFDTGILGEAIRLNNIMLDLFWDDDVGGFFLTPKDGESLLLRPKEIYDGALPSGNAVALHNLLRLERLTANPDLGVKARLLVRSFSDTVRELPSAYTHFLSALDLLLASKTEVVIVGEKNAADTRKMLSTVNGKFLPHVVVLLKDSSIDPKILANLAPFTAHHNLIDGKAAAYFCCNYTCESPTNDAKQLLSFLQN